MIPPTPSIEVLENRIAPALFFVGTATTGDDALTVHKGDALAGTTTAETDAKTAAGSTLAVLLSKGDTLIFDANNNHAQDAGDTILMKVTNGQTMVFLTDSAAGATTGAFDKNEISGLAVSDKFKAQIFTDINGSVVTALDGTGGFTANGTTVNLEHSSIAEFKSSGQVVGHVFAGGSISKVSAGGALFNVGTTAISIDGDLATGTSASGATVAFGATVFTVNFQVTAGENGGSISGVTLAKGVRGIFTGIGGESETGAGGAGGSISKVTIAESPVSLRILTGSGADGFTKGGVGGSITDVDIKSTAATDMWSLATGAGGDAGKFKGAGGAGGSISAVSLEVAAVSGTVSVVSGDGGNSPTGKAGAGGAINGFTFINNGAVGDQLTIASGDGGALYSADGRGNRAADSGVVSKIAIHNRGGLAGFDISSGQGGQLTGGQGSGGNSGALSGIMIDSTAANSGLQRIHSGEGGGPDGESLVFGPFVIAAANAQGNGGNSGSISNVTLKATVGGANPFEVYAGVPVDQFAGSGGKGSPSFFGMQGVGAGAKGGNIGSVTGVTLDAPTSKVIIGKADAAGMAISSLESVGGNGGAISKISGEVGTLDILAPSGGSTVDGKGGAGGSISKVNLTTVTQFVHLLAAGNGGNGGIAGAGGSVSDIKVAGDIGNVTQAFGLTTADNVMGGLVAGQRGTGGGPAVNGSIAKITAGKIAAILAGRPDASQLTAANAVTKISAITATAIGAETNLPGSNSEANGFTFNDGVFGPNPPNGAFALGEGDMAIDGLVIVKLGGGGASLPVAPLKLIQV